MPKGEGFFITGTDTGVGKTVITAGLLGALRKRGLDAVALKPIQSGGVSVGNQLISEDARFYQTVSAGPYSLRELNPVCLEAPLAPAVAATVAGLTINLDEVVGHCQAMRAKHHLTLVEGAGGLLVPLVDTRVTVADLAERMGLPLVIVARPNLGTINHTALTVAYARARGLEVAGIIINRYDHENPGIAERTNPKIIEALTGIPILGLVPKVPGLRSEGTSPQPGRLITLIEQHVNLDQLLGRDS